MNKLAFILLLVLSTNSFATTPSLDEVRLLYQKAVTEKASCQKLTGVLQAYNERNNPLLGGYRACATMVMAKHVINPFSKLSYFSKGKQLLEKTIEADAKNVELRFLRFAVQTNLPSFLGYKDHIQKDKAFLIKSIVHINDLELKQQVVAYLKSSDYVTAPEKQNLHAG
jgi:hypothetical protein